MNRESEMARGIVGKYKVQSGMKFHVVSVSVLYVQRTSTSVQVIKDSQKRISTLREIRH